LIEKKYKKVIREGWYKKNQLEIIKPNLWNAILRGATLGLYGIIEDYTSLSRLRGHKDSISVAYSYIFLHIMCNYAHNPGIYMKFDDVELWNTYNINEHPRLVDIDTRMNAVVFDDAPEMVFYTRKELEKEIEKLRPGGALIKYGEQLWNTDDVIRLEGEAGEPLLIEPFITDPVLIRKIEDHNTLLWLRNEYLHWSADWLEPGFNPTGNGKRTIHAG